MPGDCSWPRSGRLARFFEFYTEVTSAYVPELHPGCQLALRGHDDVLDIIETLKTNAEKPRAQVTQDYFTARAKSGSTALPPPADQNRAFNVAVKVMTTLSCCATDQPSSLLESGIIPLPWADSISLKNFVSDAFPRTNHCKFDEKAMQAAVTARLLQKVAGLRIEPTDDLRNHLKIDHEHGTVEIFHLTGFLKEHLMATRSDEGQSRAAIPRALALETLNSLQDILFPSDGRSQSLLRSLISRSSFDPDCANFESAPYRIDEDGHDNTYASWDSRLVDLYDAIENPQPRGWLEKWFERRSGARYVMMATFIGVIIAIILGLLGLAVAIFQAWVAYQQWKHPVSLLM